MNRLVFERDAELAAWAVAHSPGVGEGGFGPSRAIGIMDPEGRKLLAAAIYHAYDATARTGQISIAAISKRWAQRGVIQALLHYPLAQLRLNKLWAAIPLSDHRTIRFAEGLGFRADETVAGYVGPAQHLRMLRLTADDYRCGPWAVRI